MSHEPCGADVAAYALGALNAHEAQAFEAHLRTCAVCAEELAGFTRVVDAVAVSAPPCDVPRGMRRRVMAAARGASEDREARAPRRSRRRVSIGFSGAAFATGLAFAVAAVIVAVTLLPGRMADRTVDATVTGSGTAALRISGGHADLVVRHFAAPPRGELYEVWLKRGGHAPTRTSALFGVSGGGNASVSVPGSLYGVSQVLVTPEPAPGGSTHPTHAPVLQASLTD